MPNCPEGALRIIDGKARLVSDLFCDGLGACLGHCPQGAIAIEERDAEDYDERKVMENIVRQGENVVRAHLEHLESHGETALLAQARAYLKEKGLDGKPCACPGSKVIDMRNKGAAKNEEKACCAVEPELSNWPVQIRLVPVLAPYLNNADLLIAADCVPFAYAQFHSELLKGKVLLVGCPKLDDIGSYKEKIGQILKNNSVKSITYAHMEVPCCSGLIGVIREAIQASGKDVPFSEAVISIKGERLA
jgi:ferredoxin